MTPEQFQQLIVSHAKEIQKAFSRGIPVRVGRVAEEHFKDNFLVSGFVNSGIQPWKRSKRIGVAKGKLGEYKTLLSGKNHLFQSTHHIVEPYKVKIVNDVPYARVHNEGLRSGRGNGFQMPKRQFIGASRELNKKIADIIENEIGKILKI